jgi:hypothetical protein
MSKIIDFFKIIGAKSSGNVELSSEEIIENAADLTREQKKILLDSVREINNAAKKIDIDSVVHTETRKGLAGIKNNKISFFPFCGRLNTHFFPHARNFF